MSTNRFRNKDDSDFSQKSVEEQKEISKNNIGQSSTKPLNEKIGEDQGKKFQKDQAKHVS